MDILMDATPARRCHRCRDCFLCFLVLVLLVASGAVIAESAGRPAAKSYRMFRLSTDPNTVALINANGQVAFNVPRGGSYATLFYDGRRIRNFGALGGTSATAAALNDSGHIAFNVDREGISRAMFYDGHRGPFFQTYARRVQPVTATVLI